MALSLLRKTKSQLKATANMDVIDRDMEGCPHSVVRGKKQRLLKKMTVPCQRMFNRDKTWPGVLKDVV